MKQLEDLKEIYLSLNETKEITLVTTEGKGSHCYKAILRGFSVGYPIISLDGGRTWEELAEFLSNHKDTMWKESNK